MIEKFEAEIFDIEVGDRTYTIEFNREGLLEADTMGIFEKTSTGILSQKPIIILYAGLKMHKPDVTLSLAKKIWEAMQEEGYTIADFNDTIFEEFQRCYQAFFTGEPKKKIVSRKLKVIK